MTAQSGQKGQTDIEVKGVGGVAAPMRTLFYDRTTEREVHLISSPDRLRAYLKLIPGQAYSGITREKIVELLAGAGVVHGLIEPGIALFVGIQNSPSPFEGYYQVARGDSMRRGEDGSVEFHVQPTSFQPRYDETDAGNIDYKQLNLIENCFAGQRVASLLPPGPGRPGRDIFGGEIPAEGGTALSVRPGPGVVVSANGRDFTSEVEGRLVYQDGVLTVSPILEIARDVDLSVGNVDFVGKVVVKGSLLDGFYINAKHGVEISGDMGAARITSEGDVKLTGGVKGKSAAIISCRSLTAHYIDDAAVEASGDVTVTREIMNSDVRSLGRVAVANGAIIGGVTCGFRGIEADTLGSEMGVATWVMAGLNWAEEYKKEEIRSRVAEYMDRIQSSKVLLEPLFADNEVTARLGSDQKSMLSELIAELRELRESLMGLLDERAEIDGRRQHGLVDQINVRKTAYMGVSVRFSTSEGQVKDSVKGPLSITQDDSGKTIRIGPSQKFPVFEEKPEPAPETAGG